MKRSQSIIFAALTFLYLSGCTHTPAIISGGTDTQVTPGSQLENKTDAEQVAQILARVQFLVDREQIEEAVAKAKAAMREFEVLCQQNNAYACYELSDVHANGTISLNVDRCVVLSKACSLKHARACDSLLGALRYSNCGPEDQLERKSMSDSIYEQLVAQCLVDDWNACDVLYGEYRWSTTFEGKDVPWDKVRRCAALFLKSAQKACETGDVEACEKVAIHWDRDEDDAPENVTAVEYYKKAMVLYETACASGDFDACNKIGGIWSHGDNKKRGNLARDWKKAVEYYFATCQAGSMQGCSSAARLWTADVELKVEKGVPQLPVDGWADPDNNYGDSTYIVMIPPSIEHFEKGSEARKIACAQGVSDECWHLAMALGIRHHPWYDQEESDKFYKRTRKLREKRCEAGYGGCQVLSFLYRDGDGAPLDERRYKRYVEMDCKQGNEFACTNAARLNALGIMAPADLKKTREFYQEVCGEHSKFGCLPLGHMYEHGIGGEKNLEKARKCYELTCGAVWTEGCEPLKRLDAQILAGAK